MEIRLATKADIPAMKEIFEAGRELQVQMGNANQWEKGYPSKELILEDIQKKAAHVCESEGEIVGVFSLFNEPIPVYHTIEGSWLNLDSYATIQRIASNGKVKGTGRYCIEWIQAHHDNIRITTHENNIPMKKILGKLGFAYCGIIYWENGTLRNAYQYLKNESFNYALQAI